MSFASKGKQAKSPPRPVAKPRVPRTAPPPKTLSRLDMLEKAVANLKQQQETLSGITTLAEKLQDFTSAESEVKSIQDKLVALDGQSAEQIRVLSDPMIQLPEFHSEIEEELKELRKNIASIESLHTTASLKGKVDLKTCEVACKEEVVSLLKARTEDTVKAREEAKETKNNFAKSSTQSGSEFKEVITGMKDKYQREKTALTDYLVEGTLRTPGTGQEALRTELMSIVTASVSDLRTSLIRRQQELDLAFSLEFLSLRAELAGLSAQTVPRTVGEQSGAKEVEERLGVVTTSLEKVEKEQKETVSSLLDVVETVEKNVQDVSSALTSYLAASPQSPLQRTELETHLNSVLFQLDMLRKQAESLDCRLTDQLARALASAEDLEAAKARLSQSGEAGVESLPNLIPRVGQSHSDLPPMVQSLKEKIAKQLEALQAVWTTASEKAEIAIPDAAAWVLPWTVAESN